MSSESNWCPEVYRSIFLDRYNDDRVHVSPCCQAETRIESVDGFDFRTSPYLVELRQEFDQGNRPQACRRCWDAERVGQKSRRQSAIEFFDLDTPSREVVLESIDHTATWACNLACVMCSEINSSAWASELSTNREQLRELGRLFQRRNKFLDQLDVKHVKKIHFNGGEPMLNDDQSSLLERLDQQGVLKDVFISYNTNGTIVPSDRIVDLWSRARLVKLFFSIDATDQAFEYVRYPAQWQQVERNIIDIKRNMPNNVMFGFNVTVGTYNVLDLPELYHWFRENISTNREGDPSDFCWQVAYNFDPLELSSVLKQQVIQELENIDHYQGIVAYLKNHINAIANDNWTQVLDRIDQRRGTKWRQSLRIGKYY